MIVRKQSIRRGNNENGLFAPDFDAQEHYAARANGSKPDISRIETKFGVKIVGIIGEKGHQTLFRCEDGTTMQADIDRGDLPVVKTDLDVIPKPNGRYGQRYWIRDNAAKKVFIIDAEKDGSYKSCPCGVKNCRHIREVIRQSEIPLNKSPQPPLPKGENGLELPNRVNDGLELQNRVNDGLELQNRVNDGLASVRKQETAIDRWIGGEYPVEPWLEETMKRVEQKDELAKCVLCGRILSNPLSVALEIGPECRKNVAAENLITETAESMQVVSELKEASKLYHEKKFQKWIVRACLTLGAPLPLKVVYQRKTQYWGYKSRPILYYLCADGELNRVDTYKRKLRYEHITKQTQNGRSSGRREVSPSVADGANTAKEFPPTELDAFALKVVEKLSDDENLY